MEKIISLILRFTAFLFPFVRTGEKQGFAAAVIIILSNAIPVCGVIFLKWNPVYIIVLYWAESVIIGIVNVIMMFSSGLFSPEGDFKPGRFLMAVFLSVFFTFHYGLFMCGHAIFIGVLFLSGAESGFEFPDLSSSGELFSSDGYLPALLMIIIGQIYYFFAFFIRNKWYCNNSPENFMVRPYPRVFVMQITIIFGGIILMSTGWKTGPIIVWIAAKTAADLVSFGWALRSMQKQVSRERTTSAKGR